MFFVPKHYDNIVSEDGKEVEEDVKVKPTTNFGVIQLAFIFLLVCLFYSAISLKLASYVGNNHIGSAAAATRIFGFLVLCSILPSSMAAAEDTGSAPTGPTPGVSTLPPLKLLASPVKVDQAAQEDWVVAQSDRLDKTLQAFNVDAQIKSVAGPMGKLKNLRPSTTGR